jgi:hypothetical protein
MREPSIRHGITLLSERFAYDPSISAVERGCPMLN